MREIYEIFDVKWTLAVEIQRLSVIDEPIGLCAAVRVDRSNSEETASSGSCIDTGAADVIFFYRVCTIGHRCISNTILTPTVCATHAHTQLANISRVTPG